MSYDRFSSWASDEDDTPEEPQQSPEPVQPPEATDPAEDAQDVIEAIEALEQGESYEIEIGPRVFDVVYIYAKKNSPANRPKYKDGKLYFTKG